MSRLDELVEGGLVDAGVRLGKLTTYKLGGPADYFADVSDPDQLEVVSDAWRGSGLEVLIVGRGSNLVIADSGFRGLVIRLGGTFAGIEIEGEMVTAGGAVHLPTLARTAVKAGLLGLEFFVGIPGSVGGAIRQNAGCHGSETVDFLVETSVIDLTNGVRTKRSAIDLDLSYRHSNLSAHHVVTSATFRCVPGDPAMGEQTMREITRWRRDHQPGGTLNAGSVFKNPPGDHAGRLIDALGLKGFRVGGASVSERHANFFVAAADATAADLFGLVHEIRNRVKQATGVLLEPEIVFAGDFGPPEAT